MGFDGVKCDTCAKGFSGEKCEMCNDGFYGYPNCQGRFFNVPQVVSLKSTFYEIT